MIRIVIPGRPVPKQRPRVAVRWRGWRMVEAHAYTPRETREYEEQVRLAALAAGARPLEGDVALEVHVYVRGRHGDWDNTGKVISDALNGVAYRDDRQVVDGRVIIHRVRRAEDERVEVTIRRATLDAAPALDASGPAV